MWILGPALEFWQSKPVEFRILWVHETGFEEFGDLGSESSEFKSWAFCTGTGARLLKSRAWVLVDTPTYE